jgi:hypothetical protein
VRLIKSAALIPCFLAVVSATAFAQQAPGTATLPRQRAYVAALTGASFGPQTSAMFAGEYGERVHRNVHAYLTLSYHEDLMDRGIRNELSALGTGLTSVTGIPWDLRGRDRGVALIAGARYLIGAARVRPYVNGGAGVINIRRTISDRRVGDVTAAVLTEFGIGETAFTSEAVTRPLVEAGVGVAVSAGSATYVDVGYRVRRAFHLTDKLDFGQFAAAVGVRF